MRLLRIAFMVAAPVALGQVVGTGPAATTFLDAFDSAESAGRWSAVHGDWAVDAGAYAQGPPGGAEYRYALTDLAFDPCMVRVRATPVEQNSYAFLSFGIVIRYQDEANWVAVRFGSYGSISLITRADAKNTHTRMARFTAQAGRTYDVAVARREDRLALFLDGALQAVVRTQWPGTSTRVGLFTECACRFDDFTAHGASSAWLTYRDEIVALAKGRAEARQAGRLAAAKLEDGRFRDDFEAGDIGLWHPIKGTWEWRDGHLRLATGGWGRFVTLCPVLLQDGSIEAKATPTTKGVHGYGVFGVMVKWLDSANWLAVRYGQYGGTAVFILEDGKQTIKSLGKLEVPVGSSHDIAVTVAGGRLGVSFGDELLGEIDVPFAGRPGRPGLYTEAHSSYDDFEIAGAIPLPQETPPLPQAGIPQTQLDSSSLRLALPSGGPGRIDPHGVVHLYVRNRGTGAAVLQGISVDGTDQEDLPGTVAWHRQRPVSLEPGELGEISVGFTGLPPRFALTRFEDPRAAATLPMELRFRGGTTLPLELPLKSRPEPVRINYVGFSPSLQRLYVYIQRSQDLPAGLQPPWHLDQITINGRDVTSYTEFGTRELAHSVVPAVVNLPAALRRGEPVVVTVRTAEGETAGHSVRALPGRFHIQVTMLGEQTREDAVRDIYRHGATCIGLCGASEEHLKEAGALGMEAFHYGRGGLGALRRFSRKDYPPIAGFWLDEMDKLPVRATLEPIREAERDCAEHDEFVPLQMINLCSGRAPGALLYYELGDAVCSAYGFYGASLGQGFGRMSAIPEREYRLTRRTFTPYFRDAEMPLAIDPEAQKVLGRESKHRRCLDPREERWLTYGCLIQGAKGIMHWNYGSGINRPPSWFSKERTVIRAGLGGALAHRPHGYELPREMADELAAVWDEIGRINVELRAIGPLVAVSDVTRLARVLRASPEKTHSGEATVEAAALVSGLDAIVLIVLNHNLKTNWTGDSDRGIESYDPVETEIGLDVPPWLDPACSFSVHWTGVEEVHPAGADGRMRFEFDKLEVSAVVVVTEDRELMPAMANTVRELRTRLEQSTGR